MVAGKDTGMTQDTFFPGTRVLVFDYTLFVNDKKTPLSITMKPATVVCWYGERSTYSGWTDGDLVDVNFDHSGISQGHFTSAVRRIQG